MYHHHIIPILSPKGVRVLCKNFSGDSRGWVCCAQKPEAAGALTDLALLGSADFKLHTEAEDLLAGADPTLHRQLPDHAATLSALEASYHCIPTAADGARFAPAPTPRPPWRRS